MQSGSSTSMTLYEKNSQKGIAITPYVIEMGLADLESSRVEDRLIKRAVLNTKLQKMDKLESRLMLCFINFWGMREKNFID